MRSRHRHITCSLGLFEGSTHHSDVAKQPTTVDLRMPILLKRHTHTTVAVNVWIRLITVLLAWFTSTMATRPSFTRKMGPRATRNADAARFGRQNSGRRGVVTLEFILVFPILLIVTVAGFEFGILVLVNQAVASSAVEGAREAAKIGTTPDEVAETVQQYLVVHGVIFTTNGTNNADPARVTIEGDLVTGDPFMGQRGNTTIPCTPNGTVPATDEVRVTVCVNVTNAAGLSPVPDLLEAFGFSLQGRVFEVSSRTDVE